eukprot:TRINITY_DN7264_c0_g1_i1.p1 TRINITY_DN7264_c0_g1~~TRINITY_DN7264_c0_g1_i1.p1  ORF type:complete len:461 (-),score=113.42 TRINITY_DN7264_c0_g1_i1:39-1277(-)
METEVNEQYHYQLSLYGSPSIISSYRNHAKRSINKRWNPAEPVTIKRKMFIQFPGCTQISRKHLQIVCDNSDSKRQIFLLNLSSNGTLLNGRKLEVGERHQLSDQDRIAIVWRHNCGNNEELFGLRFTLLGREDSEGRSHITSSVGSFKYSDSEGQPSPKRKKFNESPAENSNSAREESKRASAQEWTLDEERKLLKLAKSSDGAGFHWKDIVADFPLRSVEAVRSKYRKMVEAFKGKQPTDTEEKEVERNASGNESDSSDSEDENFGGKSAEQTAKESSEEITAEKQTPEEIIDTEKQSLKELSEPTKAAATEVSTTLVNTDNVESAGTAINLSTSGDFPSGSLPTSGGDADGDRRRKIWTPEEEEHLKKLIVQVKPKVPEDWEFVAKELGRTVKSIKHKYNDKKMYELFA